jgi:hypothetical protein
MIVGIAAADNLQYVKQSQTNITLVAEVLHRDGHFDRLAEVLAFESVALPVP